MCACLSVKSGVKGGHYQSEIGMGMSVKVLCDRTTQNVRGDREQTNIELSNYSVLEHTGSPSIQNAIYWHGYP